MGVRGLTVFVWLLVAATAGAQVQTGSIAGVVSDTSGAVLPGVVVTISGDRLIEGTQSFTTDTTGAYRFDRLPPGDYRIKFELQGFKTVERPRSESTPRSSPPSTQNSRSATWKRPSR